MRTEFISFDNLQQKKLNRLVARKFSLPRYQLRKDLSSFANLMGHQKMVLDIGSGNEKPYEELFGADIHFGIDLYETSDVRGVLTTYLLRVISPIWYFVLKF